MQGIDKNPEVELGLDRCTPKSALKDRFRSASMADKCYRAFMLGMLDVHGKFEQFFALERGVMHECRKAFRHAYRNRIYEANGKSYVSDNEILRVLANARNSL